MKSTLLKGTERTAPLPMEVMAERFEMARSRAYQLIDGASVYQNLHNCGHALLPCNEAQARPLAKIPKDDQPLVWNRVVEEAPNGHITGKVVQAVVRDHLGEKVKKRSKKAREDIADNAELPDDLKELLHRLVVWVETSKNEPYRASFANHMQSLVGLLKT